MSLFHHKHSDETAGVVEPPATNGVETAEAKPVEVAAQPEPAPVEPPAVPNPFARFDRLFDEWMQFPFAGWELDTVNVDRDPQDGAVVVRADLRGLDPVREVELTVSDGVLWIDGSHREEQRTDEAGSQHHEVRYESFSRSILLPEGVTAKDIEASAENGVLEIRIPGVTKSNTEKVPVSIASD